MPNVLDIAVFAADPPAIAAQIAAGVAINKVAKSPIFEIADIGLIGDLFKALPQLEVALG